MLQRARTPRTAEHMADGSDQLTLYAFREYVKASPDDGMRDRIVEAIDKGQVSLKGTKDRALMHSLQIALQSVIGITDLKPAILRNFTSFPFIFGDSPCVFYNRYLYAFGSVGVLGFQSPGLMILMPVNQFTQIMLYDPHTYQMHNSRMFIDMIENADTSQLNALQIHSAKSAIYFSHRPSADYVVDLVNAHRPTFRESHSEFKVHPPGSILIDGKPNSDKVLRTFESQLPLRLDLSFLRTKNVPEDENPRRPRSPELRTEMRKDNRREERRISAKRRGKPKRPR